MTLVAASACGSDSGGGGTGGNGGATGTGGSAGATGGTGTAGETGNGGAGGGEAYASCEASTDYPTIVGKTCAEFCGGDQDALGMGFLVECPQSADVPADVASTYGADAEACETICNALTQEQLCCRFGHLAYVVGTGDMGLHCPHAAGSGFCP